MTTEPTCWQLLCVKDTVNKSKGDNIRCVVATPPQYNRVLWNALLQHKHNMVMNWPDSKSCNDADANEIYIKCI